MYIFKRIIPIIIFVAFLYGCSYNDENDLSIAYLKCVDNKYEDLVNSSTVDFTSKLSEWESLNKDIKLEKQALDSKSQIKTLAAMGQEHLPDVFVCDPLLGQSLIENGYCLNLTDFIHSSDVYLNEFCYDSEIYAYPTLMTDFSVIIYDNNIINEFDNNEFPNSYKAISVYSSKYYDNYGNELIGIQKRDYSSILLSIFLANDEGQEWFDHIYKCDKQALFTDKLFQRNLEDIRVILNSEVFLEYESYDNIKNDFIDGKISAVLVRGDDVYKILEDCKEANPILYENLGFSTFPNEKMYTPYGYSYGLYINSNITDDFEKISLCIDLCKYLSINNYNISESDATTRRLNEYIYNINPCYKCTNYLNYSFWANANKCLYDLADDNNKKTIEEYSSELQNIYEIYCIK